MNLLPFADRAERCRMLAREALESADRTKDPRLHQTFLTIARGWHALAVQIEGNDCGRMW
ncbi:MAG TPA: hypothetical protein VHL34_10350 [Rhizomicrobium sp.]|nr:hypothetical protein [Rhizomicrobium sp.]